MVKPNFVSIMASRVKPKAIQTVKVAPRVYVIRGIVKSSENGYIEKKRVRIMIRVKNEESIRSILFPFNGNWFDLNGQQRSK